MTTKTTTLLSESSKTRLTMLPDSCHDVSKLHAIAPKKMATAARSTRSNATARAANLSQRISHLDLNRDHGMQRHAAVGPAVPFRCEC
jgi:hypothetical protein